MSAAKSQDQFYVRFWGVRGSVPCSGPEVAKYGGNTACLEVRCGERRLIFDAGTGLRYLGNELSKVQPLDLDIFLTHFHLDHVCGMPFFKPFYHKENRFRIQSGCSTFGCCTKEALHNMMVEPLLPMDTEVFTADIEFEDFTCGDEFLIEPGIQIKTECLNHPNGATGYRIDFQGKSICYITDTEHVPGQLDERILSFIQGASIFIYDSTMTDDEFANGPSFGHSTWQEAVRLGEAASVGTVVAFHHDPDHDDDFMDQVAQEMEAMRSGSVVAREGMVLKA
jgi:phosphoribosyl 1,2-cyclic phosphodiesterase